MKNTLFFISDSGNHYKYELSSGSLECIDQSVYNQLINIDGKDKNNDNNKWERGSITGKDIINQFINTPDIVFELTESCNLNCTYCIYGEAYYSLNNHRRNSSLSMEIVKNVLDFVRDTFDKHYVGKSDGTIGFYGGEPLLKMDLIKSVVSYGKQIEKNTDLHFDYNMTTNATLLNDITADYLSENNFDLLISLDGNENNHSFRKYKNGNSSFNDVIKNIDLLQKRYPKYFETNVSFNSVIHKNNSYFDADSFIFQRYGKHPILSDLTTDGLKHEYKEVLISNYNKTTNNKFNDTFGEDNFAQDPMFAEAIRFIYNELNIVYADYFDLFVGKRKFWKPTGTCLPFSRKLFVTCNGDIFPCENVPRKLSFGNAKNKLNIDFEQTAKFYESLLDKHRLCHDCYRRYNCLQCVYSMGSDDRCKAYMKENDFINYLSEMVSYFEKNPISYKRIVERVSLE